MDYDFSTLSPHDFELLTQDLLQRELKIRLEGFKTGRDLGIDLRRCEDRSIGLIVQCKHYARTSFSKLKSELAKKELPKVAKLKPKRYVLATSKQLSVKEKDDLVDVLGPYCHSATDVLGAEDLNALLRKYPEIEKSHYKLWVPSAAVLQAVLNNDLFSRSYIETDDIKTRLSLFVPTDAVTRAMDALQTYGFCLLSGIPGIGKTTTAEMLVALMLSDGWECVCISSNASEALKAYDSERRQLFYYDDFLGQTSLTEKLGKNEDHELTRLIKNCSKRSNSKRLVLTTRDYLLAQAIEQHEVLTRVNIDGGKCIVKMADYTPRIRAQVLVNHLWFYGVKDTWCKHLVETKAARKIVDHPNYSPRLVEAMCDRATSKNKSVDSFAKDALDLLDNPSDLWRHPYQNQLNDSARELLICFASLGSGCYVDALEQGYRTFISRSDDDISFKERFRRALRELDGTFLQVEKAGNWQVVAYHNPSVKDFMDGVFASTPACFTRVLKTAAFYNQVEYAARFGLGQQRNPEAEKLVCVALRKFVLEESAIPERVFGNVFRPVPVRPAKRLLTWRWSYSKKPHTLLKSELCNLSAEYLNNGNYREDNADDISELVRLTLSDTTARDDITQLDSNVVKEWLWNNLRSLDDYIGFKSWVEDWDDNDSKLRALDELRERFMDTAERILQDLTLDDDSSSSIEEQMVNILNTAEELGVPASLIDMDEAEEVRQKRELEEQHEAELHSDDWQLRRMEELANKEEVDDILDSLR